MAVPTILPVKPYEPPKIQNSTLVALEAEASKAVAVPDNVAPFAGTRTLVVGLAVHWA